MVLPNLKSRQFSVASLFNTAHMSLMMIILRVDWSLPGLLIDLAMNLKVLPRSKRNLASETCGSAVGKVKGRSLTTFNCVDYEI